MPNMGIMGNSFWEMYVRTDEGLMAKFIKQDEDLNYIFDGYVYYYEEDYCIYKQDFEKWLSKKCLKASYNIIDLITVGDYVNGSQVCMIKPNEHDRLCIYTDSNYKVGILESEIKSILTKEQIEQCMYKVGELDE